MHLTTIQIISLCVSLFFLGIILWFVRQKKLKEAYSLIWILSGIALVVVSAWTDCLNILSRWIGIYYPPMTLFLILFAGIILLLLQFSLVVSKGQEKTTRLTQEVALLKQQIKELQKKQ